MDHRQEVEDWFYMYSNDIYHFLIYYTGTLDVEDLVQDVFVKAIKGIHSFNRSSLPKTWLISIARRTAVDHKRKQRFAKIFPIEFFHRFHSSKEVETEKFILNRERDQFLYETINKLKPIYREIIILKGIAELKTKEITEITGWTETKVNTCYHRAKRKLKEELTQKGKENLYG